MTVVIGANHNLISDLPIVVIIYLCMYAFSKYYWEGESRMKKKTIKLLKVAILLVSALIAIVVYRGTVSTCKLPARPFPSHTFEVVDSDGEEGGAK